MAESAPAKSPAKKRVAKPKKPASHPKYSDMIRKAVATLAERGGSSRQAILKYIIANYKVNEANAKNHLKLALRAGIKNKTLKQCKGTGASGSFKVGDKAEKTKKPKAKKATKPKAAGAKPKTKKVRKPKAAGVKKSPKKAAAKKPKAAKKSPKKAAKPKAAKKSPAKKAAKPKKTKSPKKKAAAKK